MPLWLQHLLVLALVAACGGWVLWQGVRTLRSRGRLGSCCARGCEPVAKGIVFLPASDLSAATRRRKVPPVSSPAEPNRR